MKKLLLQKALDMARGTKVKYDLKMLKRIVKKNFKKKKTSSKQWEERKKMEKEAMDRRQAKGKANIEDHKKMKRLKKTKGQTPGF